MIIVVVFAVVQIPVIKKALDTVKITFPFPGVDVVTTAGKPVTTVNVFTLSALTTAGTLMLVAGVIVAIVLRVGFARTVATWGRTVNELKWAILAVAGVLALAYVMIGSGQTTAIGLFVAGAGAALVFLSPVLGWFGVTVSGSDTSANALFGALQVTAAQGAGLPADLLAAANSSGGVLGKMISPQNLAIAAGAVGMAGREGDLFRRVVGWSLLLLLVMCVLVTLQGTPVLSWMIP